MSETWWVSEKGKKRGPFSFDTLIEQIGTKSQLVHLWQEGFENWKQVADVPEVAEELANRARRTPPPPPPNPAPVGLGGWLWLVGIGQVLSLIGSIFLFLAALGSRFQGEATFFIGFSVCAVVFHMHGLVFSKRPSVPQSFYFAALTTARDHRDFSLQMDTLTWAGCWRRSYRRLFGRPTF